MTPSSLPSLVGLSADARALLHVCAHSRAAERPGRRKAHQTTSPKTQPIIPVAKSQGVSRSEIVDRCAWWGERWTLEQVTAVVDELVAAGILMRSVNGIRFSDAWGPLIGRTLGEDLDRVSEALGREEVLKVERSAGMIVVKGAALRMNFTPSNAPLRVELIQELDDLAALIASMREAAAGVAS